MWVLNRHGEKVFAFCNLPNAIEKKKKKQERGVCHVLGFDDCVVSNPRA